MTDADGLDPDIREIQDEWMERYRRTRRIAIVFELDGYGVHDHTIDGVAPATTYATKEEAAARLLQLLDIKEPVTPQSWPERVCIGFVEREER